MPLASNLLADVPSRHHPIHVAMITQGYLPLLGGAERQIAALAPLLKERGINVHVITRRYSGLKSFETIQGVPVHRLPTLRTKALSSFMFTIRAIPLIRSLRPHIIHAHGLLSPTTTAVAAKRVFGIPVVSKSLRGGILGDLTRLTNGPLGHQRFQTFQKHVDAFITISNEIEHELIEKGISPKRCVFIPNGVKLDEFQPVDIHKKRLLRKELQLPEGPLAIFAGRLENEKRVGDLIQVWHLIRQQYADANLLILGTGSQEAKLKQMATEGVLFGGAVKHVAPYLQTADVFVLPSVAEGLSNALLEALATGVPVIVTATGGTTDIVRHKVSGWLIRDYESKALLEGILAFLGNQALREQCASEGRRYVLQNYSLINTADNLYKLYNNVLFQKVKA
ncbi:MAG: glycosyltransferase family 4 protein [Anaerolineales bacterium]|nr:glycosyltransferase family 4 protein [Anaerolineales bacterium]